MKTNLFVQDLPLSFVYTVVQHQNKKTMFKGPGHENFTLVSIPTGFKTFPT